MNLFRRKKTPLSAIIEGLLCALDDAREMQRLRQEQLLEHFPDTENGEPVMKNVKIDSREIPLASLVSHDSMEIEQVNIMFRARISDIATRAVVRRQAFGKSLNYPDLKIDFDKIEGDNDDAVMVSICFRTKEVSLR